MVLLVRNQVQDVDRWKQVFDRQAGPAAEAGLTLRDVWRSVDDGDQVWFLFDVEDRARAEAYMADPKSADVGREAGALGGEAHFLEAFAS